MMQRTIAILNQVLLVLLLLALPPIMGCKTSSESSQEDALNALLHSGDLQLKHEVPLEFDTHHVQGLDLTGQFYFVTSVDNEQKRGWLFKIHRQDASLHSKMELTDGTLIHPGGVQYDGHYLWIPTAEYRRESRTTIYAVDPNSLEIRRSFPVDDHIGALASDGKNLLYGVNWDAVHFYMWDFDGHQLNKVDSPTSMAYQDIKYFAGRLLCSGHKSDDSAIDVIDPENWTLVKRIHLPRAGGKNTLSREGMTFDGSLYFLPDDGPDSHIMIFTLD
ncbi:MAG: DUF6454 family protein [Planctomycetota bacterium]